MGFNEENSIANDDTVRTKKNFPKASSTSLNTEVENYAGIFYCFCQFEIFN